MYKVTQKFRENSVEFQKYAEELVKQTFPIVPNFENLREKLIQQGYDGSKIENIVVVIPSCSNFSRGTSVSIYLKCIVENIEKSVYYTAKFDTDSDGSPSYNRAFAAAYQVLQDEQKALEIKREKEKQELQEKALKEIQKITKLSEISSKSLSPDKNTIIGVSVNVEGRIVYVERKASNDLAFSKIDELYFNHVKEELLKELQKAKGRENLFNWAKENGSDLLKARIEENLNWYSLANQEYFQSILPEGFKEIEEFEFENLWENADLESINKMREIRDKLKDKDYFDSIRLSIYTFNSDKFYGEDFDQLKIHTIDLSLKSLAGEISVFSKKLF